MKLASLVLTLLLAAALTGCSGDDDELRATVFDIVQGTIEPGTEVTVNGQTTDDLGGGAFTFTDGTAAMEMQFDVTPPETQENVLITGAYDGAVFNVESWRNL